MMSLTYQLEILFFQVRNITGYKRTGYLKHSMFYVGSKVTSVRMARLLASREEPGWKELHCFILDVCLSNSHQRCACDLTIFLF